MRYCSILHPKAPDSRRLARDQLTKTHSQKPLRNHHRSCLLGLELEAGDYFAQREEECEEGFWEWEEVEKEEEAEGIVEN